MAITRHPRQAETVQIERGRDPLGVRPMAGVQLEQCIRAMSLARRT